VGTIWYPFGVWRNKSVDPGIGYASRTNYYDDLFADPMVLDEDNYIDYILPQLYWSIDHRTASYKVKMVLRTKNTAIYIEMGLQD
jgi:uncharacterized lipoprotein YddW (UPF0748 family)